MAYDYYIKWYNDQDWFDADGKFKANILATIFDKCKGYANSTDWGVHGYGVACMSLAKALRTPNSKYKIIPLSKTGVTLPGDPPPPTPEEIEQKESESELKTLLSIIRYAIPYSTWDKIHKLFPMNKVLSHGIENKADLQGNAVIFHLFSNCFKNHPEGYTIKLVFDTTSLATMDLKKQLSRDADVTIYYGFNKPDTKKVVRAKDLNDELRKIMKDEGQVIADRFEEEFNTDDTDDGTVPLSDADKDMIGKFLAIRTTSFMGKSEPNALGIIYRVTKSRVYYMDSNKVTHFVEKKDISANDETAKYLILDKPESSFVWYDSRIEEIKKAAGIINKS